MQIAILPARLRSEKVCTLSVAQIMSAGAVAVCASLVVKRSSGDANDKAGVEAVEAFAQKYSAEAEKLFGTYVEAVLPPLSAQPGVLFQITQDLAHYVQLTSKHVIISTSHHGIEHEDKWTFVRRLAMGDVCSRAHVAQIRCLCIESDLRCIVIS